ncbi:MAG TPA: hypothetical protein VMT16_14890, partial [Thermoanaerobaculia bacterium]|nr:hypothetical protein [Thermoanaerobaculia bacterium]
MRRTRSAAVGILIGLLPVVAEAQIRVDVRPDGTRVVTNEGAARRGALRLVALPQAPWWRSIADQARHHALEPRLVQAVIQVESG